MVEDIPILIPPSRCCCCPSLLQSRREDAPPFLFGVQAKGNGGGGADGGGDLPTPPGRRRLRRRMELDSKDNCTNCSNSHVHGIHLYINNLHINKNVTYGEVLTYTDVGSIPYRSIRRRSSQDISLVQRKPGFI